MMDKEWIPTKREGCLRYTGDLRLLLGTREQVAAAKRAVKKRSLAAKAGWDKRRAAALRARAAQQVQS